MSDEDEILRFGESWARKFNRLILSDSSVRRDLFELFAGGVKAKLTIELLWEDACQYIKESCYSSPRGRRANAFTAGCKRIKKLCESLHAEISRWNDYPVIPGLTFASVLDTDEVFAASGGVRVRGSDLLHRLPLELSCYAGLLASFMRLRMGKRRTGNRGLSLLLIYVTETTGKYHFGEIASLVQASRYVLGKSSDVDPESLRRRYSRLRNTTDGRSARNLVRSYNQRFGRESTFGEVPSLLYEFADLYFQELADALRRVGQPRRNRISRVRRGA